jgi:hypothetical protein
MENFIINPSKKISGKKATGAVWILFAIVLLFVGKGSLDIWKWMTSIWFCLMGVIFFTPLVGPDKPQIEICEGGLKIIWINWIRKITVLDSEIESIILTKNGVIIKRKDKRPLKIIFYSIEKEQKTQAYKFFIEYAQLKSLVLERQ